MRTSQGEWLVVSAAEQRRLDALAAERGASADTLVESAGRSAADWILDNLRASRAVVIAGPGGNGADGLVVARHLLRTGIEVETFLVAEPESVASVTRRALEALERAGGRDSAVRPGSVESSGVDSILRAVARAELIVDGLYGSGLARPLDGVAAKIVAAINGSTGTAVSLDTPSGVSGDGGNLIGPAVRADVTLAMEYLKPAHLLFPAAELCGKTHVVDVAYPPDIRAEAEPLARVLAKPGAKRRLPARPADGHKGTFGHVLLVAGSSGMMGAAILCGRAALRAGAGLLTMAVPVSQAGTVHAALPEALVTALAEESGCVTPAASEELRLALDRATVLAIGPGLSRADAVGAAIASIVEAYRGPVIADADALFALARDARTLRALAGRAVLTPHPGEFANLTGRDAREVDKNRIAEAQRYAREHDVVLVLKGRPTAIGLRDGRVYLNPTGNSGLATGGSGDALTGILAGLVAGGATLEDAALVGPYIHGLAADLYSATGSERSLMPSDVVDLLPRAFLEVEQCA